jgi:hypothetical protein
MKVIKWLIELIPEEQILELLKWVYGLMPVKDWIKSICDWLEEQAKKTENEVDDEIVRQVRFILYRAFKIPISG